MNPTKQLIAIDFGSTKISVMAGEVLANGALKVISAESKVADDVKWGIIEKPSGASFKVNELLKLLTNSSKILKISHVSASIGAKSMKHKPVSISRFVGKPNIVTDDLLADMLEECERNSQLPESTIFDVFPTSYLLDGKRIDEPVGKEAIQITGNYHLIVGNSVIKTELERCFDRTGIVLEHSPLAIDAISTVVLDDSDRDAGVALINLGATTTTLAVYHDGALQHLMVVPLGGKNITKDIQELGIAEEHAEKLKCVKGCALEHLVVDPIYIQIPSIEDPTQTVRISTKFLSTIIEARIAETLLPIFKTIDKLPFTLEAGIVITGGGSKLANITELIMEKTGIYTRFGNHSEWLSDDTDKKFFDPSYAQLIGTLLLTDEYRKEHPIEEIIKRIEKEPKIKGKKFTEKISTRIFDFFNDENKLN